METKKTVFTTQEISNILKFSHTTSTYSFLQRAKKDKRLLNPRKGIRTLPVFNTDELACTLYPKSYISLETVLYEAGVIFQWYGSSTRVVWSNTREYTYQEHNYIARKMKDTLLYNDTGVKTHRTHRMATPERALCDMVYLRPKPQLDNPQYYHNPQSNARLTKLLPLYPQTVQSYVEELLIREI
jgi:hypothetical protein